MGLVAKVTLKAESLTLGFHHSPPHLENKLRISDKIMQVSLCWLEAGVAESGQAPWNLWCLEGFLEWCMLSDYRHCWLSLGSSLPAQVPDTITTSSWTVPGNNHSLLRQVRGTGKSRDFSRLAQCQQRVFCRVFSYSASLTLVFYCYLVLLGFACFCSQIRVLSNQFCSSIISSI